MSDLQIRLRQAREAAGLSQTEVARRIGIAQPTYSDLENKPGSSSKHLVAIASVLGVNAAWLAYGKGPRDAAQNPEDAELLQLFHGLDADRQRLVLRMLRSVADEQP